MQLYNRIRFLLLATFLLPAMGALAQPDFTGSDVLVNTTTANSQQNPSSAMDSSGNYVVVWESYDEDGDGWGIYAQLYLANGTANGSAFKINSTTTYDQRFPDVAMRADGEFCVVWQSWNQDGDGWGCYRRCYDASGSSLTSESRITNSSSGHQRNPKVSMNADGFIAWTWMAENEDGDGYAVMTRATSNTYSNLIAESVVNTTTTGYQGYPDVAVADDQSYVVVWQSENQDGDGMGIYGQAYDINYTATGSEFLVNTTTSENQQEPAIGMDSAGNYIVVWSDISADSVNYNIYAQRYTPGGTDGSAFQVNTTTGTGNDHPRVAMTKEGSHIVVWESYGTDGSFTGAYGQVYFANQNTNGGEFLINTRTTDFQQGAAPAAYRDSVAWVVAWQDGLRNSTSTNDGDNYGVYHKQGAIADTTKPTAVCQNLSVYLDGSGSATIAASDLDGGSSDNSGTVFFSASSSSFACIDAGSNVVTLTVSDSDGNSDDCQSIVVVADSTAPTAVCNNLTLYLDGSGNASLTAGDADGGSSDNCSIATESLSQTSYTCSDIGTVTPTLTLTDGSSNSASCTASVTVVDSSGPTAVCQNLTVYLDGSGSATLNGSDADGGSTDNCSSPTFSLSQSSFTCADLGSNSETLTVTDGGSNTSTCATAITVVDSSAPTASCQNISVYLDASGNANITAADIDNGSSDNCAVSSSSIDVSAFTCADIGPKTVTLSLADASSNASNCTSTVTVVDSTSPSAVCNNISVYLDGSGSASITTSDIDGGSSDNCSLSSTSLDINTFACSDVGANTVTLTAADASTNSGTCSSTVTVIDSTAPTAVCQNITAYLGSSGTVTVAAASVDNGSADNCSVSSYSLDVSTFACSDIGTNSVVLTAADASTNSATCAASVTVVDSTAPTASCQNLSVYLDASGNASITTSDVDNGSSDNCAVSSSSLDVSTFTCADVGANTVTLSLADASSNSATCSSTVTVVDSTSPTALCQSLTVYLDGTGNATITSNDVDNGSSDNCSVSSTIDISSFTCSDVGANTVTLTAADASSNSATCSSTVTVVDSTSPTAVCQNISVYLDGSGSASITASDVDNGSADNCSSSSSAIDINTFACADVGANTVTLTVTDASTNSTSCASTVTVVDSTAPTASCQNLSVYLDGSGNASITTSDVDNGSSDNCAVSSSSLDVSTFTCADIGSNTVTLSLADASSNSANCSSTVTVVDSTAPTALCQSLTVYLDGTGNATITSNDVDNGSSDNCSVSSTIDISSFTCSDVGANTVTLTAADASSNSATCSSTVTVVDSTSPTAVCQNISVYLDGSGSASITASDVDNGSADNCSGSSNSIDVNSFTCADVGANTVTLTVTDASTNSTSCASTVTVVDSTAPTASCQNLSVYLDASGNASITTSDVDNGSSDNCAVSSSSLDVSTFTCADIGANTVTLSLADASSNSATCSSTVTVVDSTSPTALCQSLTVYLDGTGNATITSNDVDNGSSDNCSVSSTIDISSFTCSDVGANTVTLTAADASSNSATCSSTVTVVDSTSPTAVCQNISVYLDGSGSATITASDVDNGSADNCAVSSSSIDVTAFTCSEIGANTVTLTALDASTNSGSCTSTVTVIDSIAPTAACQSISVYLDGSGNATVAGSDIDNGSADACGISSLSLSNGSFTCSDIGSNTVTLTATDAGSNTATCSATVTVVDSTAPAALCQNISVYLDATGNANISSSDVDNGSSDNCSVSSSSIDVSTFNCGNVGANTVTLTLVDGNSNSSSCAAVVTVGDSIAPVVSCQNDTVYLDAAGSASVTPSDVTLSSSDNCSVSSSSLDVTTFGCGDIGLNAVVLTVTDASNNTGTCQTSVLVLDSVAPTAVCTGTSVYLDATGSATLAATDIDFGSSDNCGSPTLSVNATVFGCGDVGVNSVTLTVSDASGNLDSCQASVSVNDTIVPDIVCQSVSIALDTNGSLTLTSSDVDGGTTDNCAVSTLGLDIVSFTCADLGPNTVTLTAVDPSGNTDSCTATVTVVDIIAPDVICLSDTVYLGPNGTVTITAASLDGGSTDECGIASLSLSQTVFNGSNIGVNQVTLTATDGSGNSADCISNVTVLDTLMSGIEDGLAGASFVMDVYPNPTYDNLNVKIVCEDCWSVDGITLRLVNVTGQVVFEREIEVNAGGFSTRIDLSQVAAGPYMLSMEREGERIARRVVKL